MASAATEPIDDIDFSRVTFDPTLTDMVIYHGGCYDGFSSATVIKKYLREVAPERESSVTYYGAVKRHWAPSCKGKNVVICDFSYDLATINRIISEAASFVILDHHITAERVLAELSDQYKIFRMDHSGAYLTWRFFFREDPVPLGIRYVEDNDIFACKMVGHKEFSAYFSTLPMTFENYLAFLFNDALVTEKVATEGMAMWKLIQSRKPIIAAGTSVQLIEHEGQVYAVAILNSADWKSELGNYLITETHSYCDFSVIYHYCGKKKQTRYSFRSTLHHSDVEAIVSKIGGGGHRNASGLTIDGASTTVPKTRLLFDGDILPTLQSISLQRLVLGHQSWNIAVLNTPTMQTEWLRFMLRTRTTLDETDLKTAVAVSQTIRSEKLRPVPLQIACCFHRVGDAYQYTFYYDRSLPREDQNLITKALGLSLSRYPQVVLDRPLPCIIA